MRAEVLVGPQRRRRWSIEEKLRIVGEASGPGVRVADVARRHDVARAQIYQWRSALRSGRLTEPSGNAGDIIGFLPVDVAGSPAPEMCVQSGHAGEPLIEIGLVCGRLLKVPASLPTAALRRLIRAVESA